MTVMVVPSFRFSVGMALAGLAQFREKEICKPLIGGSITFASSWSWFCHRSCQPHITHSLIVSSIVPVTYLEAANVQFSPRPPQAKNAALQFLALSHRGDVSLANSR
jgi:hypothetical protein